MKLPHPAFVLLMVALAAAGSVGAQDRPADCYSVQPATPYPFNRIFDLRTSPTMVDPERGWSQEEIDLYARTLIDEDPDNTEDIFPRIWNYYCHGDSAPEYDAVRFRVQGVTYTRIRTDLYFQTDCCANPCEEEGCPDAWPAECRSGGWIECSGYGVYRGGNHFASAGGLCPADRPDPPERAARSSVWSHELAHLCDQANKPFIDGANSELLATGAEYLAGERWQTPPGHPLPTEYDTSLMIGNVNNLRCPTEARCKYNQYRLFNAYLFTHFSGPVDSLDLVYRWVRYQEDGTYHTSFYGLGHVLMEAPFANQVSGAGPGEKMGTLYQRFAMARYADEPVAFAGRYGFGPEVSPRPMGGFFAWPDTAGLPRVRSIPPVLTPRPGAPAETLTAWTDPVQPWGGVEPCRVLTTGTDYLVFTTGEDPAPPGPLTVRIRGTEPIPPNQSFRLGYLAYDTTQFPLYERTPVAVVETIELPHGYAPGDTLDAVLTVPGFGDGIESVVVVLSMVQTELTPSFWGVEDMDYAVIYSRD